MSPGLVIWDQAGMAWQGGGEGAEKSPQDQLRRLAARCWIACSTSVA